MASTHSSSSKSKNKSKWWLPGKHQAHKSADSIVSKCCSAAREVFVATRLSHEQTREHKSGGDARNPLSAAKAEKLKHQLLEALRSLLPLTSCFYSRDQVNATVDFAELFGYLVELFCEHVRRVVAQFRGGETARSRSVVELSIRAAVLGSTTTATTTTTTTGLTTTTTATTEEDFPLEGADDTTGHFVVLSLVRDVYDFLKRSSLLCWLLLRSDAIRHLAAAQRREFVAALLDHLNACFLQHDTLLGVNHAQQDSAPKGHARKTADAAQERSVLGVISFNLAVLSCALQSNASVVRIVHSHPQYIHTTRQAFRLLSNPSARRTAEGGTRQKPASTLSASSVYALAFACEVVGGTTAGAAFFSEDNLEYALHVVLSVVAARPYSSATAHLGGLSSNTQRSASACHQRVPLASLVQRLCAGVIGKLVEHADTAALVERCMSTRGLRRLLTEVCSPADEAFEEVPPIPTRSVGLDGRFGTPTGPPGSGRGQLRQPRYHDMLIDPGLLSQATSRFEMLTALMQRSRSAVLCSRILLAGGAALLEWLAAVLSLTPPPSLTNGRRQKPPWRGLPSEQQFSQTPSSANAVGSKDWTSPVRNPKYNRPNADGHGGKPASEQLLDPHFRCAISSEAFQAAALLLRSLMLLNASGSVGRFFCRKENTGKDGGRQTRQRDQRQRHSAGTAGSKSSVASSSDLRPSRPADCVLSRILAMNFKVIVQGHINGSEGRGSPEKTGSPMQPGYGKPINAAALRTPERSPFVNGRSLNASSSSSSSPSLHAGAGHALAAPSTLGAALVATALVGVAEAALQCNCPALAYDVAVELVHHSATIFWLAGFHTARARAEARCFQHGLASIVNSVTEPPRASPHTPGHEMMDASSFVPESVPGTTSLQLNVSRPTRRWQSFAHSRAAVDIIRLAATAVSHVASSSMPYEAGTFSLGPGRSSDSRFVVAIDEALDEAMQHLERVVCGTPGASVSFGTLGTAVQTSNVDSDPPVLAALDVDAHACARVGGGGHVWRCLELGHAGSDMRSHLAGEIGPSSVLQQVPGSVDRQPPFVAPLLACLYAGNRAHALAAVACWTAVASASGAFATQETDEGAMPTATQGFSTAKLSPMSRISLQGVRPLVEGIFQVQDWLYDCIDHGLAAQLSLRMNHRRSVHQLRVSARDKERTFKARESHLVNTLQSERRASQAALQASRFEAEKALSREARANSRMQEAFERADKALEDFEVAKASLQIKQREVDDAQRQIGALSSTVSDLRDENSSWRKQVDEMGRTMAEMGGGGSSNGAAQANREELEQFKRLAAAKEASLTQSIQTLRRRLAEQEAKFRQNSFAAAAVGGGGGGADDAVSDDAQVSPSSDGRSRAMRRAASESLMGSKPSSSSSSSSRSTLPLSRDALRHELHASQLKVEDLSRKLIVLAQVHNMLEEKVMALSAEKSSAVAAAIEIEQSKSRRRLEDVMQQHRQERQAAALAANAAQQDQQRAFLTTKADLERKLEHQQRASESWQQQCTDLQSKLDRVEKAHRASVRKAEEDAEARRIGLQQALEKARADASHKEAEMQARIAALEAKVQQGETLATLIHTISGQHQAGEDLRRAAGALGF